ncbi:LysR family transcriptional regulator [Bosea sp. (in: a-proteobacteria)]|uniref:LysR family transcriptional regulator n=1 Tax=Bosea sp. (in: a-proteobacteria) TaxID=1871050 RepID=UPI0027366539|nr:LysR family transcriptional regulator [Bosea sp. (in: a-proteobacteria)]MDP3408891.1 LysR family transcriptional regulator [Bosea sp. (in: a-proteobacteria)]
MDRFGDLDVFAHVVTAKGMSAAGRQLNLSPAVISKRIRRLEERLGVRLLQRTTRQLSLTEAGQGFYERVVSILSSIEDAEAWVASGAGQARGTLRVSAPTSFGRLHIAPHLKPFLDAHPLVSVELVLGDGFIDIVGESFDLAIRIADLRDSSLVAKRLAPNHRVLCATPGYLAAAGVPATIEDLSRHTLIAHNTDHWTLDGPTGPVTVRVAGPLRTNSSEVVREALLAGLGIALRSTWDVGPELKSGALQRVLPAYSVGSRVAIHAVYPSRRHMEQKVRAFVDYLAELYGQTPYWDAGLTL